MLLRDAIEASDKADTPVAIGHRSSYDRIFVVVPGRDITPSFDPLLSLLGEDAKVTSRDHLDTIQGLGNGEFIMAVGESNFLLETYTDPDWFLLSEEQVDNFRREGVWNV